MNASQIRVVLCTCPPDAASSLARALLEERLVACVNIVAGVKSLYWWQGQVTDGEESLLVIKTRHDCYGALEARLNELHPYEVPEILALEPQGGADSYISWVFDTTRC